VQAVPGSEVTLAAALFYGHSALRKVVLRHLQDTDELPPILMVFFFAVVVAIFTPRFVFLRNLATRAKFKECSILIQRDAFDLLIA